MAHPVQMHLTILPHKLHIASLPKQKLQDCAHQLLKLLFFTERLERFFSYTETEDEISLILETEDLDSFSNGVLNIENPSDPPIWRAVQVSEGTLGFSADQLGIVQSLSAPLARAGISIFYVSTFDTDFVLVEERYLEQALGVLKSSFSIATEGLAFSPAAVSTLDEKKEAPVHKLAYFPAEYSLCRLLRENFAAVALPLIKFIFYPEKPHQFFSWTESESKISLMIHREAVASVFPFGTADLTEDRWRVFKVDDGPLGFTSSGIVAAVSAPISEQKITVFYMSAYRTDWLLVRGVDFEAALKQLEHKFTVIARS